MPKIVEYPLAPFDKVLKLAQSVDYLGGSCTIQDCAANMKKKVTGGFGVLISSAIKHDLIIRRRDRLLVSDRYNKIKLSYNNLEKVENQRASFFHPALYKKILDRFHDKELPVNMLPKLLIREFQVEAGVSEKIAGFFMEGVKQLQLLKEGKLFGSTVADHPPAVDKPREEITPLKQKQSEIAFAEPQPAEAEKPDLDDGGGKALFFTREVIENYVVTVKGKGLESTIIVHDQDDLAIVEALLSKIRKTL